MTNKRFKDFGSGSGVAAEPVSFTLHGEEFHCRPEIQGKTLLTLMANTNAEDPSDIAKAVTSFFDVCLLPESSERFNALLEDPDRIVTVETLGEITGWLVEEYSARPTQGPGSSAPGQ